MQNAWTVNGKFAGLQDEEDPLTGNRKPLYGGASTAQFSQPQTSCIRRCTTALSPFIPAATIHILKQTFASQAQFDFGKRLSINPWHGLTEHRPLGNQSRARRRMYKELSMYRQRMNNVTHFEPDGSETFE